MTRKFVLLFVVAFTISLIGVGAVGSVSAQENDRWCLNTSNSSFGTEIDCSDRFDTHETVNVSLYQSSGVNEDGDIVVNITARTQYDIRESGSVDLTFNSPSGSQTESISLSPGSDVQSISFTDVRDGESGQVYIRDDYSIDVDVFSSRSDEPVETERIQVGSFYVDTSSVGIINRSGVNTEEIPSEGDVTVTPANPSPTSETVISSVSRYNDGVTESGNLKDTSIPPREVNGSLPSQSGFGELKQFGNIAEENSTGDATIQSVDINGDNLISMGMASFGVPAAEEQSIEVTYEMQTQFETNKGVGIEIVDAQGNVIDDNVALENVDENGVHGDRWFNDTVNPQYRPNVFEDGLNEDALYSQLNTIELTEREKQYVNDNFELYMVFRTEDTGSDGGITVFKPNQIRIISSDESIFQFNTNPEFPVAGEDQLEINVSSIDKETLVSTDENGNEEAGQIIWTIEDPSGNETTVEDDTISPEDADTINLGGEYTSIDSYDLSESGTYNVQGIVEGPNGDNTSLRTKNVQVFDEEVSGTPGEISIVYSIDNTIDPLYGTHNVEPSVPDERVVDTMDMTVTAINDGNSRIERTLEINDTLTGEHGYTDRTRGELTVEVEPGETRTYNLQEEFMPHEYGTHEITVVDSDGAEDFIRVEGTEDQVISDVYVQQPATLEVTGMRTPDNWLIEDPFTASARLKNVGDLSTSHPASETVEVQGEFGSVWEETLEFPDNENRISGGDARQGSKSSEFILEYSREGYQFSPNFPHQTVDDRLMSVDGPFDVGENGTRTLEVTTDHKWAEPNLARYNELEDSNTDTVELYSMQIFGISPTMTDEIAENSRINAVASPYRFTDNHFTTTQTNAYSHLPIENSKFDNEGDIMWDNYNPATMQATEDVEYIVPLITQDTTYTGPRGSVRDVVDGDQALTATVAVRNTGGADSGFARVIVRADEQVFYPDDFKSNATNQTSYVDQRNPHPPIVEGQPDVVGMAGVEIGPYETKEIEVPLTIPNHPENEGRIIVEAESQGSLSAELADGTQDYAEQNSDVFNTQLQLLLNVDNFGDALYVGYDDSPSGDVNELEGVSTRIDQTCEGYGLGTCSPDQTEPLIDVFYRNVGGDDVEVAPIFNRKHNGVLVSYSEDRYTSNLAYHHVNAVEQIDEYQIRAGDNVWDSGAKNVQPNEYVSFELQYEEPVPGYYDMYFTKRQIQNGLEFEGTDPTILNNEQNIFTNKDEYESYDPQKTTTQVYDVTDPVSRWHTQDCTDDEDRDGSLDEGQCLDDMYNGLSSITSSDEEVHTIYEGGAIRFDGQSRADFEPVTARDNNVTSDNVGISSYDWSITDPLVTEYDGMIIERFDESGTYTVSLNVEDHTEYTEGDANSDTETKEFVVIPDNQPPDVTLYNVSCSGSTYVEGYNSIDNCWTQNGELHVWSEGDHTDGATVQWGSNIDEDEIGVEFVDWSTTYGSSSLDDGNFDSATTHNNYDDSVGPRKSGDWYATTQDRFSQQSGGSDSYDSVTTEITVTDFAGNSNSASESFTVVTDNTDPTWNCTSGSNTGSGCEDSDSDVNGEPDGDAESNYDTSWSNSASAEACVEINAQGPNGDGIGFDTSTASASGDGYISSSSETRIVACVNPSVNPTANASASASASANATCSEPSSCGECDTDEDEDSDTDYDQEYTYSSSEHSSTVSVEDYHGNGVSVSLDADVEADAFDTDKDTDSDEDDCEICSDDCEDDDDDGDCGSDEDCATQ